MTERVEFVAANDAEIFSAIPAAPAVFLLRADDPQSEPYVSKTANLRRRAQRILGSPTEGSRRLNLRERVLWIEYTPTGSDFESGFLLYRVLRSLLPKNYSDRLRLRFAPLVKLHLENEYPRASVTTRLGRLSGRNLYYGPFPSRSTAEKFASDSLDFFKMRRCVDDLHPDPVFPGCIYSEMKMCLAPCFKGCTDDEYSAEVARVQNYLDSSGGSLVREISAMRDQASSNLDFENAAALHARIDKIKPVLSQLSEIVHRIDRLAAVMIQRSAVPGCVALFQVNRGLIAEPVTFAIQPAEHTKSQSMESRLQGALAPIPASSQIALETMEHLAILKRWYYRSRRAGEIFFADENGTMPWRRIVRGIARVYRGEQAETSEPTPNVGIDPRLAEPPTL
ncbi:MAG TPA: UvrB/UvrC motif-containing protein [Terriglobales bacterium]|nr:UvrB/UvrC motif-containing protein [Terriglobales bacterium]